MSLLHCLAATMTTGSPPCTMLQPVCDAEFMQAMKDHANGVAEAPVYESPTAVEPEPEEEADPEPEPEPEQEPDEDLPDEEEEEEQPEDEKDSTSEEEEEPPQDLPDLMNLETPKAEVRAMRGPVGVPTTVPPFHTL
jgi:hypothetical protein